MGKKILVPCLDVKMIAFFPKNIQWKIIFLILNTAQGSFYPLQSYSKKTLRKNVLKSARKYTRNVLMPPGHPIILFKCGRRTGKKVYSMDRGRFPRLLTVPYFFGISSRSSAYRYGHPCRIQISEGTVVGVCNGGGREAFSQTIPAPK